MKGTTRGCLGGQLPHSCETGTQASLENQHAKPVIAPLAWAPQTLQALGVFGSWTLSCLIHAPWMGFTLVRFQLSSEWWGLRLVTHLASPMLFGKPTNSISGLETTSERQKAWLVSHLPEGLWRKECVRIWDRVLFHVAAEVVYIGGIACLVSYLRPLNQVSEVEGEIYQT